jgi:hypothetical protein
MLTGAVVLPAELEAVIVYVVAGVAIVGVPLMMPVAGPTRAIALVLRRSPAGSGGLTLYEVGAPPVLVGTSSGIGSPMV